MEGGKTWRRWGRMGALPMFRVIKSPEGFKSRKQMFRTEVPAVVGHAFCSMFSYSLIEASLLSLSNLKYNLFDKRSQGVVR